MPVECHIAKIAALKTRAKLSGREDMERDGRFGRAEKPD
jgi:hypothetical protein